MLTFYSPLFRFPFCQSSPSQNKKQKTTNAQTKTSIISSIYYMDLLVSFNIYSYIKGNNNNNNSNNNSNNSNNNNNNNNVVFFPRILSGTFFQVNPIIWSFSSFRGIFFFEIFGRCLGQLFHYLLMGSKKKTTGWWWWWWWWWWRWWWWW